MPRRQATSRIVGYGITKLGKLGVSASSLMEEALRTAISSSGLRLDDLDGLVAVPSLSNPRFMEAHNLATQVGLLPGKNRDRSHNVKVRTIDTGGAGPVSALLEASRMIQVERCQAVAIVAGDAVSSMETAEFLRRADAGCRDPSGSLPSPCIPHGYDRVAQWQLDQGQITREQLAMVPVLMSHQACRHPLALCDRALTLDEVTGSPQVAPVTSLLECARRTDGGAALVVCDSNFIDDRLGHDRVSSSDGSVAPGLGPASAGGGVVILGGGEASGPLYPPDDILESMFSCEQAATTAYSEAQLTPQDIDWFGLYDCFPICFIRAVEACGLASKGNGGALVETIYDHITSMNGTYSPASFPVNTHGGLTGFGAPWEVPAMYSIIEAVQQLSGTAGHRQISGARRALVYGNGGIFSHSAVAILSRPVD